VPHAPAYHGPAQEKWTVGEDRNDQKEDSIRIELPSRNSIGKPFFIQNLPFYASILSAFTDQRDIAQMPEVDGSLHQKEHSQEEKINEVIPWKRKQAFCQPPEEYDHETINDEKNKM
jgi:hypothetical protein